MNTLIFCTFLFAASTDTLPPIDSLQQSLINYYQLEAKAQVEAYKTDEKLSWIKYVPSPSLGYTLGTDKNGNLTNQLRPSLSFNFMNIYNFFNERQAKKYQINSIILKNENKLNNELLKLYNQFEKLKIKEKKLIKVKNNLTIEREIFEIEENIFKIKEAEYNTKLQTTLLPSQFLAIKKKYLNAKKSYQQKLYKIEELQQEVKLMQLDIFLIAKKSRKNEIKLE